jgi:mannose-6-phosphate isomerase
MIDLLDCSVMPYAWGSRTAIADLMGKPSPSSQPEAELWMGAHPMAPSRLSRNGQKSDLGAVIAASATRELGAEVEATYGPRLPFLMKLLAAAQPLSLQAHPNAEQAKLGFADEDRRGIPRDAKNRSYKDASHKPELLCALVPVEALCGFRRVGDTLRLFDDLAVRELEPLLAPLRNAPGREGLAALFGALMTMRHDEGARVVAATVAACRKKLAAGAPAFRREVEWATKLAELYPGDVGVVSALLSNLVQLEPDEALYLGAGNLHAYLSGFGVEVMASSDNVLRGGLTTKHVDVPELMRVLDFADGPATPVRARALDAHERVWDTPAREFRLSAIELNGADDVVTRAVRGPEIVVCTKGAVRITPADGSPEVLLAPGSSAFVAAATGSYDVRAARRVSEENAQKGDVPRASLYRVTVNLT